MNGEYRAAVIRALTRPQDPAAQIEEARRWWQIIDNAGADGFYGGVPYDDREVQYRKARANAYCALLEAEWAPEA